MPPRLDARNVESGENAIPDGDNYLLSMCIITKRESGEKSPWWGLWIPWNVCTSAPVSRRITWRDSGESFEGPAKMSDQSFDTALKRGVRIFLHSPVIASQILELERSEVAMRATSGENLANVTVERLSVWLEMRWPCEVSIRQIRTVPSRDDEATRDES
ncbi:unnamed protein product [Clonostachys rhizophaga]|uniref:Uncharacterized protein n=1 Tax=Clonostachys rhizophaga TaxID=160324 RepID=A0A9N9YM39_9HYPO|nr:unnamed protein product [Clonostachys rhizophaga]